jgi:hypothetical protein
MISASIADKVGSQSLFARRVDDEDNDGDDDDRQAAEAHQLLMCVLLVLAGLVQQPVTLLQIVVSFLHLLQTQLDLFSLAVYHDTRLCRDVLDLVDQSLDLLQLSLLLLEDTFPHRVLVSIQQFSCKLLLLLLFLYKFLFRNLFPLDMLSPLSLHMV